MSRNRPTIYDIAKLANTSTATVSRVLNDTGYPVKEELKKRVIKAAKELNYTPNLVGRHLKTSKSNDIGVIVPSISNPYYSLLVNGVENVARKRGYNILLCNSHRDPQREKDYLESLYQKQVEGIIISSITSDTEYIKKLQINGLKIAAFDQDIDLDCNKVNFDYYRGGCIAAQYLIDRGHRDIGFISAPLTRYSRKELFRGFADTLKINNIAIKKDLIKISEFEEETEDQTYEYKNGKQLVQQIIKKGNIPSAIFCINDMTAFGVIQGLQKNHIQIPQDVSVMGFDNITISEIINPSLTTIDQCTHEMGSLAAEVLINNIEDENKKYISTMLQPTLVVRNSTK
ncbi:LacI family DNA-binding transcriptional regulator [Clostridiisalibacter paucivorans]|uniref:LacI family DNA-binding transcriptional regulator n=1 Tax=Clostridiisalibacter paucivorans TaxID=408753 RepID=UPI0005527177|nr:LacI family DNA-binding transcriptional regulator [Clostridiisalibacter paucivorans]